MWASSKNHTTTFTYLRGTCNNNNLDKKKQAVSHWCTVALYSDHIWVFRPCLAITHYLPASQNFFAVVKLRFTISKRGNEFELLCENESSDSDCAGGSSSHLFFLTQRWLSSKVCVASFCFLPFKSPPVLLGVGPTRGWPYDNLINQDSATRLQLTTRSCLLIKAALQLEHTKRALPKRRAACFGAQADSVYHPCACA